MVELVQHKFDVEVENALAQRIIDNEYRTAETNAKQSNDDYEDYLGLLNCERSQKKYSWLSNVTIPEFTSLHLLSQGLAAVQNFSTRDFTEVYIGDPKAVPAAHAEKKLINNTLNQRHLYYYNKIMRANSAKDLDGVVYIRCWWEQKLKTGIIGTETQMIESDVDINGDFIIDRANQVPDIQFIDVPVEGEIPEYDRFNFDILDRRDVFVSSEYTYSLQEKKRVIIRYRAAIDWLEIHREEMSFFNLALLKDAHIRGDERGKGTHSDDYGILKGQESDSVPVKDWLIVERYGLDWVVADGTDGVKPAQKRDGSIEEGAELRNIISAFAVSGTHRILIRFHEVKYQSATGEKYIPLIRWICYVHPTRDEGMGDGKCSKELQYAMDDNVNLINDRTMLSTFPTMIGRKDAMEDNDTIYWEPEHIMRLEDPVGDLRELKISGDISAGSNMIGLFKAEMEQLQAINPSPSPSTPVQTATAEASAESRTTVRNLFKQFSAEHTFYTEFYWMISQMTWQFAREETILKLMGDTAVDFNPSLAYSYTPITSAIETEHGKRAKIQTYLQMVQVIGSIENPKTPAFLNFIMAEILKLQGAEFEQFKDMLLDESVGGGGERGSLPNQQPLIPSSNQRGFDQSQIETNTRQAIGA